MIILCSKTCIYDVNLDETIIYGIYDVNINKTILEGYTDYRIVSWELRPGFYIAIKGKHHSISKITFSHVDESETILEDIVLEFPFEKCNVKLDKNRSGIISTMCKDYSHRLEEWIEYNLNLGFSGIVIFDNSENTSVPLNEPMENCRIVKSNSEISNKYIDKVFFVNFPYTPFPGWHYDNIQLLSLHIGVNAFKNKCRNIALIDADEFIYTPKNPKMNIETFLQSYDSSITMRSNILTNKNDDDIINNNILQISEYVGEDKYTKTILFTPGIGSNKFINGPHNYYSEVILDKEDIIHYHCWVNTRYKYHISMEKIDFLKPQ